MDPLGYKLNAQVTETTILDVKMMMRCEELFQSSEGDILSGNLFIIIYFAFFSTKCVLNLI